MCVTNSADNRVVVQKGHQFITIIQTCQSIFDHRKMEQQKQRTAKLEKKIADKQAKVTERRLKTEAKKKEELEKKASIVAAKEQQNKRKMFIVRGVSKHPCLFDKSHLWYYKKDKKDAAWKTVQEETGEPRANKIWNRLKAVVNKKTSNWRPSGSGLDYTELEEEREEQREEQNELFGDAELAAQILIDSAPRVASTSGSYEAPGQQRPNVPLSSERPHKSLDELVKEARTCLNEAKSEEEDYIIIPLSDEDDQQSIASCDNSPAPLMRCSESTQPVPTTKRAAENSLFQPATKKRKGDSEEPSIDKTIKRAQDLMAHLSGNQQACPLKTGYNASFAAVLDNMREDRKLPFYAMMTTLLFEKAALEPKKE